MENIKFNNTKVQKLYDIAHSREVALLENTADIKNILLPLINDVINDTDAYFEAKKWNEFNGIVKHIEENDIMFIRMDEEASMCFSLYMFIYH